MVITKFIDTKIETSENTRIKAKAVYLAYKDFAENLNLVPLTYKQFRIALSESGISCIYKGNVYFFENISLIENLNEMKLLDIAKAYYHLKLK